MFNKPTTGLFGGAANTSFGTSGTSFGTGTTPFGTTGFGSTGFGAQPTNGGLFGGGTSSAPAAAATGGLFGVGGTSTFGATPATNTGFSFGTATATVQPTVQTVAGAGGLFGTSTTGFGGAATQPASLFGNASQPMGGSTFGAQPSTAGSLFGGASFLGAGSSGTTGTVIKFIPVPGTDIIMKGGSQQSVATKLQCITGMKEYENKSLEELRLEDYAANRKGPQLQQQQTGLSFLGSTSQTTQAPSAFGVFGQPTKPAFSGFGAAGSTGTSTSLFGQPQPQQPTASSLFGASSQPKSLFGTATTTTTTSPFGASLFGQNTAAKPGLFGATPATQSTGLFGATSMPASSTSGFGTTGFGSSNTFGTQATSGGLFGQKPTGFGATAPAQSTSFNFGQPQQQQQVLGAAGGGMFGTKSTAANTGFSFGQSATTGFPGFGATVPSVTLGSTAPFGGGLGLNLGGLTGTNLFQQSQAKPATTGLGFPGFGGTGMGTGLNLGTTNASLGLTASMGGASADLAAALLQQQQQVQQHLQVLNASPYGDSPLFRNLKQDPARKDELLRPTNPEAQKATLAASSQLKVTNRPNYRIKPKPLQSIITGKGQLFDGLEEDESNLDAETFVPRRNFKKLVIRNSSGTGGGAGGGGSSRGSNSPASASVNNDLQSNARDSLGNSGGAKLAAEHSRDRQKVDRDHEAYYAAHSEIDNNGRDLHQRNRLSAVVDNNQHQDSYSEHDDDGYSNTEYENSYNIGNIPENGRADTTVSHPTGVVLRRPDYYTLPSLDELAEMMDENGACWVENFVVGRDGYGNVVFPELTNVSGLDLDEIVHFRSKEIDVYPNDENKPPVGEALNKKAQVTLDRVWPVDKTSGIPIKDYDRLLKMEYPEKLEKAARKIGAKFVDYRHETGSWVFEVKHFSKYGLLDDSDDDEDMAQAPALGNKNLPQQPKQQLLPVKLPPATQQQVNDKQTGPFGSTVDRRKDLGEETVGCTVDEEDAEMSDIVRQDRFHSRPILDSEAFEEEEQLDEEEEEEDVHSSSVCLAKSLGVSAAQVQLQKASFFGIDEDDFPDETYLHAESPFAKKKQFPGSAEVPLGLFSTGKQRRSVSPAPQKMIVVDSSAGAGDILRSPAKRFQSQAEGSAYQQSAFRKMVQQQKHQQQHPSFVHPLVPSGLTVDRRTLPKGLRCPVALDAIPYDESLLAGKQRLLMDVGLVHSRQSRVGWTCDWTFAHSGTPLASADDQEDDDNGDGRESVTSRFLGSIRSEQKKKLKRMSPAQVVIESVSISVEMSAAANVITDLLSECLQVELEHSDLKAKPDFPLFVPTSGVQLLHSYSEKMQSQLANSCDLADLMFITWTLCTALWGDLQLTEEFTEDTYVCQQARKFCLAQWLTISSEPTIEREVQRNCAKGNDGAAVVFSYLTGGLVEKACEHALANQNYHLALLIAQATGSEDCKTMIRLQLAMWADTSMDNFIDKDYLRLYALLAGTLVWKSSDQLINTCAELDWKRCLAVHLWFMCSSNAPIKDSLQEYEKAYNGLSVHGTYAAPPRPSYMEKLALDDRDVLDVCYHLLKLYCDRTHPLHVLLNPSTMSGNQLDYSLSWHLLQVLKSLGYDHLSDVHQSMICTNYASQLESLGLWHWAVFVLLHIDNDTSRSNAVHQLLLRHVSLDLQQDNGKEDFIIDNLHIKPESIHLAKAIRAKTEGRRFEEAWHLLKARKWNQCHDVIITNVAPEAIVNENYDMLQVLLRMLADPEVTCHIRDWNTGGGLYVDYIDMMDKFQHVKQSVQQGERDDFGSEMENLYDLASSLGTRINSMLCNNHLDSVCQAMISKHITDVITLLMREHPAEEYLRLSADLLSSLPLPEDFAVETLAQMSHYALQAVLL